MLNPSQVLTIAEACKKFHCTEASVVTGQRPEQKYSGRGQGSFPGYSSTVEYITYMSELVLEISGLLPFTLNAGSLTKKEESGLLQDTNVSLAVTLITSSEWLNSKVCS